MYPFSLRKIILVLSFLALDAIADDSSLLDAQALGTQVISPGWTLDEGSTNESILQQASELPPPIVNNESLLLSDESVNCADQQSRPAPGKLRRLRIAKREQQPSCSAQEFREPGAQGQFNVPAGIEDDLSEGSTSVFDPNRKTRPTTMRKLINEKRLRPTTDISVCGYHEGLTIPVCAPYFATWADAIVLLLHPCRFCERIFSCTSRYTYFKVRKNRTTRANSSKGGLKMNVKIC